MRVCLMIEGQEGVTWDQWRALAETVERSGFEALFRSDHYLSVQGRHERGSLDAWTTLAAIAAVTSRIRLGTLVSPATFRHPSVLAKSVVTVDHVSGGRAELGIGTGWLESEHRAYGFPFADMRTRMDVLAEQIEIVHRSWKPGSFSFDGSHYCVEELDALPKPVQEPHPTLLVGGLGGPRSLALAAKWADEYNTVFKTPAECRELHDRLQEACDRADREPLPLSLMTGVLIGSDEREVERRRAAVAERSGTSEPPDSWVVGTPDQVADQLHELESAGVRRVMLQHLLHDDLDAVELLGREVISQV